MIWSHSFFLPDIVKGTITPASSADLWDMDSLRKGGNADIVDSISYEDFGLSSYRNSMTKKWRLKTWVTKWFNMGVAPSDAAS